MENVWKIDVEGETGIQLNVFCCLVLFSLSFLSFFQAIYSWVKVTLVAVVVASHILKRFGVFFSVFFTGR